MNIYELEAANEWCRNLRQWEKQRDAIKGMLVIGVSLGRHLGDTNPINLQHGQSGGGSVTSIGFPEDLREALMAALDKWATDRVMTATEELKRRGITLE